MSRPARFRAALTIAMALFPAARLLAQGMTPEQLQAAALLPPPQAMRREAAVMTITATINPSCRLSLGGACSRGAA